MLILLEHLFFLWVVMLVLSIFHKSRILKIICICDIICFVFCLFVFYFFVMINSFVLLNKTFNILNIASFFNTYRIMQILNFISSLQTF